MIFINLQQIIDIIPSILQYFIPGYIFLTLFNWITAKTQTESQKTIFSCVISFISASIIQAFNSLIFKWDLLENNIWVNVLLSVLVCTATSIPLAKLFSSKSVENFVNDKLSVSLHEEILNSLIHKSANLKIYFKNKDYYFIGHLDSYSIEKGETMICVKQHIKYDFNDKEIYTQEHNDKAYMLFNLKEVEYIEIFNP